MLIMVMWAGIALVSLGWGTLMGVLVGQSLSALAGEVKITKKD